MVPKILVLAAWCGLACCLSAGGAHAATKAKRDCRTAGVTVAANKQARVFYRRPSTGNRSYYACDVRHRRARALGFSALAEGITPHFALRGTRVAYEDRICEEGSCAGTLYRRDVTERRAAVVAEYDDAGLAATDIEMSSSYAVYAIRRTGDGHSVIRAVPGDVRVLDPGPSVEPRSLAVAGRTAYWTAGSQPRSFRE